MRLHLVACALALALAGCAETVTDAAPATPEARALAAMERLGQASGPDGDLKRMTGSFRADGMSATLDVEVGSNGVEKTTVSFGGLFGVTLYCKDGAGVLKMHEDVYRSRSGDYCKKEEGPNGQELPVADFLETPDDAEVVEVTAAEDGSLVAVLRETNATGAETLATARVDPEGRVVNLTVEDDEGVASMTLEYGVRRAVQMPEATKRIPASVESTTTFDREARTLTWTATGGDEPAAPLADFQARVVETFWDEEDAQGKPRKVVHAAFPLAEAGEQRDGNFTFRFFDDGDGVLDAGDRFAVASADWEYEWMHEVEVYDAWADAAVGENPLPGLGAVAAFAAGAVALALRRRVA